MVDSKFRQIECVYWQQVLIKLIASRKFAICVLFNFLQAYSFRILWSQVDGGYAYSKG